MEQMESLSCICLHWKTVKPYPGGSRRTPYFRLGQNEMCLESVLWSTRSLYDGRYTHYLEIRLIWRGPTTLSKLYSQCYLTVGDIIYPYEKILEDCDYDSDAVYTIFREKVNIDGNQSIMRVKEWTVICQLSYDKPFRDQAEKRTIYLSSVDDTILPFRSVDKSVQVSSEINRDIEALSCDFSRMFKEEILPDFKLKCRGRIFKVHRSVLASRSEVFRAKFHDEMHESGSVDIQDLQVPILDLLLKFIYSGKLEDITVETALDLYEAADKYAVPSLITAFPYYMSRNVTVENCVYFLKTANSHSDPDLKDAVVSFVIQHPSVFKRTDWMTFSAQHPILANEVLQSYVSSINQ